jgi:hypothetical protein
MTTRYIGVFPFYIDDEHIPHFLLGKASNKIWCDFGGMGIQPFQTALRHTIKNSAGFFGYTHTLRKALNRNHKVNVPLLRTCLYVLPIQRTLADILPVLHASCRRHTEKWVTTTIPPNLIPRQVLRWFTYTEIQHQYDIPPETKEFIRHALDHIQTHLMGSS